MHPDRSCRAVLLAAISGSSRLMEKLGETESQRAVERCLRRMERSVSAFDGTLIPSSGGELMAFFDSPDATIQAARDMRLRVEDLPPVSGVKLSIRIGFSQETTEAASDSPENIAVRAAARLAGLAGAGQIFTDEPGIDSVSETLRRVFRVCGEKGGVRFVEVLPDAESIPLAQTAAAGVRLSLQHSSGKRFFLDWELPSLSLGRDAECDLQIKDRRASRSHARIELRGGIFVLKDTSTNGTYVRRSGEEEFKVRGDECVLSGRGTISFASSAASAGAEIAEYELLVP